MKFFGELGRGPRADQLDFGGDLDPEIFYCPMQVMSHF